MEAGAGRRIRLLMVEDNPGDVELFRWALQRAEIDCDITVIDDGGQALAMVRRESAAPVPDIPDLIVLDLNLPKADGREILGEMRSTTAFANVPVVVLTSSTSQRERQQLEALHIARHIVKASDLAEFLKVGSAVKEVLEATGQARDGH